MVIRPRRHRRQRLVGFPKIFHDTVLTSFGDSIVPLLYFK